MPELPVVENDDNIIKVRVERSVVRDFPFDVFYLVPFARKDVLPRMFPWSLCLPPIDALIDLIANLRINIVELLPHAQRAEMQDWQKGTCLTSYQITLDECFVTVPILPLMTTEEARKKRVKLPSYFVAPRHVQSKSKAADDIAKDAAQSKFAHIITEDAVLFTPDGPIQPICTSCPRHMMHMLGKCALGCKHCFDELVLKRSTYEQLQDNNTDQDSDS
jgi:hypothetical protein